MPFGLSKASPFQTCHRPGSNVSQRRLFLSSGLISVAVGASRYSSYGRHFTKSSHLNKTAELLCYYLRNGDTAVDFSCGANAFVPMVKRKAAEQGKLVAGRAFDIITSHRLDDFVRQSWMDVQPGRRLCNLEAC